MIATRAILPAFCSFCLLTALTGQTRPAFAAATVTVPSAVTVKPAAPVDLADTPLATAARQIKPNIAMIVDDSGSMIYSFVPDKNAPVGDRPRRCDGAFAYNPLYYNPNTVYKPPYKPDGKVYADGVTRYPDSDFTRARFDGYYDAASGITFGLTGANFEVNLGEPQSHILVEPPVDATGNRPAVPRRRWPLWSICDQPGVTSCAPDRRINYYFSRNTVNPASTVCEADEQYELVTDANKLGVPDANGVYSWDAVSRGKTNYANWYTYYRIRGSVMKQAASEAFMDIDPDRLRVGLFFINSITAGVPGYVNEDYPIDDFTGEHRRLWFERLQQGRQAGWTPLRGALSRAGQMYAGLIPKSDAGKSAAQIESEKGKHWDPVQYSCQRNQAILATDGAWNANAEDKTTTKLDRDVERYGAFDITGARIGQLDDKLEPPYRDTTGSVGTLADVAYYFYATDLRVSGKCVNTIGTRTYGNLCDKNNKGSDVGRGTHMTTSTIGFGVDGDLAFDPNYFDDQKKFFEGKTWPEVVEAAHVDDDKGKIDDVWHAAVNGRGIYFNAKSPEDLKTGIQKALQPPDPEQGANTAVVVPDSLSADNGRYAFGTRYRDVEWSGDVFARSIDKGAVAATDVWSANKKLLERRAEKDDWADRRRVYYFNGLAEKPLADFTVAGLDEKAKLFADFCQRSPLPSQCIPGQMTRARRAAADNSANLIAWLRGDGRNELAPATKDAPVARGFYRRRENLLGDVVNAMPTFAGAPPYDYFYDSSYVAFREARKNRAEIVYAGANDGMLHAFHAGTGVEAWSFVPTPVMEQMWRLADTSYDIRHRYLVDGKPVLADVCKQIKTGDYRQCEAAEHWRSILVAGLGKGGCGYYALDVTQPEAPEGLWEFTDDNLGYSFGEPIVAKLKNGRWVVIIASGYNNTAQFCGGKGDGRGHLFMLDAMTGKKLLDIVAEPSKPTAGFTSSAGLARLNAWIDDPHLPVVDRVYGADLQGNLWRFDIDDNHAPKKKAFLMATFTDTNGKPQTISTRPVPVRVKSEGAPSTSRLFPAVIVGTGRYLGITDAADRMRHTVYAIRDDLVDGEVLRVRDESSPLQARRATTRKGGAGDPPGLLDKEIPVIEGDPVDWNTSRGWYLDLALDSDNQGERVNLDMLVYGEALLFVANSPAPNICDAAGGRSWLFALDVDTGKPFYTNAAWTRLDGLAVGLSAQTVFLGGEKKAGELGDRISATSINQQGETATTGFALPPGSVINSINRSSWRELIE